MQVKDVMTLPVLDGPKLVGIRPGLPGGQSARRPSPEPPEPVPPDPTPAARTPAPEPQRVAVGPRQANRVAD